MIDLEGFEMSKSDCEYRNEDGTCSYKRCAWWEPDVECEPDGCACYSSCEAYEEDEDYEEE